MDFTLITFFLFAVPYQRVECPNGEVVRKMYVDLNVPRLLLLSDVNQNCNGSTDLIRKKKKTIM
jgi:hypothetical protein